MKHVARRIRNSAQKIRVQSRRTLATLSPRSSLTVFMYHSVTEDATRNWGPWRYAVTPTEFEEHISIIAEQYNVVTMDDVSDHISDSSYLLPENAAVVTFDDGYRDTLTQAVPVLERYGVPATIYVTTDLIGDPYGPFEFRLAEALRSRSGQSISISDLDLELPDSIPTNPKRAYRLLRKSGKWESPEQRAEILGIIEDEELAGAPMLDVEEIQSLSEHKLITVGAHAHYHVPLTTLSEDELLKNIMRCVTTLQNISREPIEHFSYPYGAYDSNVKRAVQHSGMVTSVTTSPEVIFSDDIAQRNMVIPRIDGGRYSVYPSVRHSIL